MRSQFRFRPPSSRPPTVLRLHSRNDTRNEAKEVLAYSTGGDVSEVRFLVSGHLMGIRVASDNSCQLLEYKRVGWAVVLHLPSAYCMYWTTVGYLVALSLQVVEPLANSLTKEQ